MKLTPGQKIWFYNTGWILWISGGAWWIFHRPGLSIPWLLAIHGAAAMIFLVVFGVLIPTHIKKGRAAGKNLASGHTLIAVTVGLAVTGYGLYYSGNETLRAWTSAAHSILGLGSPLLIAWHLFFRRKRRRFRRPGL